MRLGMRIEACLAAALAVVQEARGSRRGVRETEQYPVSGQTLRRLAHEMARLRAWCDETEPHEIV